MKLRALSVLLLLALGGCASINYRHPADYEREHISYVAPNDCRSLEKRYAIALAWEKNERENIESAKINHNILSLLMPFYTIAKGQVNDTDPEYQNDTYLSWTKKTFLDNGCKLEGYEAFNYRVTDGLRKKKGLSMCEQDAETGFYVCLKRKP